MKVAQRVTGVPIAPGVGALGWGQRWERLINDDERRRRDTYCAATIELCVAPPGLDTVFASTQGSRPARGPQRAVFACWGGLGYLLDAPTGAASLRAKAISIAQRPI